MKACIYNINNILFKINLPHNIPANLGFARNSFRISDGFKHQNDVPSSA